MQFVNTLGDISDGAHHSDSTGYAVQADCDFLLVARRTAHVIAVNQRIKRNFGIIHQLDEIFDPVDSDILRQKILTNQTCQPRFYQRSDGTAVWVNFFTTIDHVGVELSNAHLSLDALEDVQQRFALTTSDMERLNDEVLRDRQATQQHYLDTLAEDIRTLSGFDRAMVYRFDQEKSSQVVAEATRIGLAEKFKGLTFPHSDVPSAARARLEAFHARQIFDVEARPQPIVSTADDGADIVFDQSLATSRPISTLHQTYLRNMGVRASLVLGLVVHGHLWGLIICHHQNEPRRLDPSTLTLVQVVANLAAMHLTSQQDTSNATASGLRQKQLDCILASALSAPENTKLADIVAPFADSIMAHTGACGFTYRGVGRAISFGLTPAKGTADTMFQAAKSRMQMTHQDWVSTSTLEAFCGLSAQTTHGFGGTAVVDSTDGSTTLQLFRLRRSRQDIWVGDQNPHPFTRTEGGCFIVKRGTFQVERVVTIDSCLAWTESTLQACRAFHRCLHDAEAARAMQSTETRVKKASLPQLRDALKKADNQRLRDPLTGVPNRSAFESYLINRLSGSEAGDVGWLCHLDLDQFSIINATYGTKTGDSVLTQIAQVMRRMLPRGAHLACLGGDEFSIVMPATYDHVAVAAFCENLQRAIRQSIFTNDRQISVTCSIGLDRFEAQHDTVHSVLARSRLALFKAKSARRGSYSIFSTDLEEHAVSRRKLEADIQNGLDDHAFVPFFQPQIDTATRKMVGLEVLARWDHPEHGLLAPKSFLETASQMKALQEIDSSVFQQSIATQRGWKMALGRDIALSLNISVERLIHPALVADLQQLGDAAKLITLEIMDAVYRNHPAHSFSSVIHTLRKTGVGIDVDDFGSDRKSVLALAAIRPDQLKIQKQLVEPVTRQSEARDLLRSILKIGGHLGIKSVAEGVETEEHVAILHELGCDRLQGQHFGHPMPASEIAQRLAQEAS